MDKKGPLTNESIRKKFKSQFDLVSYAIKLAEQYIQSGRSPYVTVDNQNTAVVIIEEIEEGKDQLEEIQKVPEKIISEPQPSNNPETQTQPSAKPTERKKTRRIFA